MCATPLPLGEQLFGGHIRTPRTGERRGCVLNAVRRIPGVRPLADYFSGRRVHARLHALIRRHLLGRAEHGIATLIPEASLHPAAEFLAGFLERRLGWPRGRIIPEDSMSCLLVAIDDLELIELEMDIEEWTGAALPKDFFYDRLPKMTFGEAAEWIAKHRVGERAAEL